MSDRMAPRLAVAALVVLVGYGLACVYPPAGQPDTSWTFRPGRPSPRARDSASDPGCLMIPDLSSYNGLRTAGPGDPRLVLPGYASRMCELLPGR